MGNATVFMSHIDRGAFHILLKQRIFCASLRHPPFQFLSIRPHENLIGFIFRFTEIDIKRLTLSFLPEDSNTWHIYFFKF